MASFDHVSDLEDLYKRWDNHNGVKLSEGNENFGESGRTNIFHNVKIGATPFSDYSYHKKLLEVNRMVVTFKKRNKMQSFGISCLHIKAIGKKSFISSAVEKR